MQQPGLNGRHRDKNGEISRKHGNTLVRSLRKIYGPSFAKGAREDEKLSDVLVERTNIRSASWFMTTSRVSWPRRSYGRAEQTQNVAKASFYAA